MVVTTDEPVSQVKFRLLQTIREKSDICRFLVKVGLPVPPFRFCRDHPHFVVNVPRPYFI